MSVLVTALEAERAVLGSCCLSDDALSEIASQLSPEQFSLPQHAIAFEAMLAVSEKGKPIDAVTLHDELKKRKLLDEVGGPAFIAEIMEAVPHAAHASFYAKIVYETWQRRELSYAAEEAVRGAKDSGESPDEIAARMESRVHKIIESGVGRQGLTVDQVMLNLWAVLNDPKPRGVPSGYADLDAKIGGLKPQTLTILAARPSIGKSALAGGMAVNVAHLDVPVLFFSFEQAGTELAERWLSSESRVPMAKIRASDLDEFERHTVVAGSSTLSRLPITIDDTPGRTLQQVCNLARLHVRRKNVGLIVIDYLQLIEPDDRRMPREQQVSGMSRGLKCLARSLNVPVLCLAQLNRIAETRANKRPAMADLRESGAIEQDADTILLLHRPSFYAATDDVGDETKKASMAYGADDPTYAEVIIAKNRAGETGTVKLKWIGEQTAFRNWEVTGGKFDDMPTMEHWN